MKWKRSKSAQVKSIKNIHLESKLIRSKHPILETSRLEVFEKPDKLHFTKFCYFLQKHAVSNDFIFLDKFFNLMAQTDKSI